eukprot:3975982-Pyramimonas_sp.AAC.1
MRIDLLAKQPSQSCSRRRLAILRGPTASSPTARTSRPGLTCLRRLWRSQSRWIRPIVDVSWDGDG